VAERSHREKYWKMGKEWSMKRRQPAEGESAPHLSRGHVSKTQASKKSSGRRAGIVARENDYFSAG